ncbi:MAG: YkgJ family cysteine cluster protein [Vulcanimicrobiota bacterium]
MHSIPYVDQCTNCGECCKTPGIFLPEQIEVLAAHFSMTEKELCERYLIVQLCTLSDHFVSPADCVPPVFILSPVKADIEGKRLPQRFYDSSYSQIRDLHCIFRDNTLKRCSIQDIKPFECSLTACSYMTKDNPIFLGKRFYHHKWKDAQETVTAIFPELEPLYQKLKQSAEDMKNSFEMRNKAMHEEIATIFNGYPHEVPICI